MINKTIYIVVILGLAIFMQSCFDTQQDEKSIIETQKELLIGKWGYEKTPNSYRYEFFSDDTWKGVSYFEGKKIIKKGKYVLGDENEVFIRPFGSQHWPNDDTINDYKTSLGVYLYYLYDTVLISNQEDYKNKYYKIKDK